MHQSQMYPPEDVQKYSDIFQKCAQMESASSVNIAVCNNDGKKIPVQVNTSTVQFNNQKVICGIFRDMTDQKQLQQQLADSERLYRDLYRNAKAALYRTRTIDGKLLMCNMALASLHGYDSIEDCLEKHHGTAHYVDKNRRKQLLDKLREDNRVESFEYQIRHPNGKTVWVALTAEIFPEQGWIEGMVTDISASKILTHTEL